MFLYSIHVNILFTMTIFLLLKNKYGYRFPLLNNIFPKKRRIAFFLWLFEFYITLNDDFMVEYYMLKEVLL